jgi:hypothetical protein
MAAAHLGLSAGRASSPEPESKRLLGAEGARKKPATVTLWAFLYSAVSMGIHWLRVQLLLIYCDSRCVRITNTNTASIGATYRYSAM